ncbi:cyclin-dependent kinase A-1-like isoform X3 [Mangifera indica]|uniref:cyclin-dependent kinase A-1-like isoform X2 n=1 Tax=Mangifera indica TaxID=29780 RepID=UPI001CFB99F0|nr:cyclin-dependent kinase A-1-like isoform X2 [Mangifera indica]XP_044488360.1 cyclin-dependent kinase A-1-like isoform X2 [Mangifera indica]XP_044488361.1 cyclin-dependent kinase A-1-like isoform X3 [Mangifera indica]
MARFNVQEEIGGDSFGKFERCTDNGDNGKPVYVKSYRIEDVGLGVPISLICQISLLKQMDHPRITRLQEVLISITASRVYQVFEYAGPNLKDFLKNSQETAGNRQLTKSFMHQILTGIYYYHSNNFVHGFLTPYQLLIDIKNNRLKVAHVGMAVTPSFKAPEIMLGFKNYSFPADVWSIGCIFAEMVLLKPLFGSADEFHERGRIFSFMGTPNEETMPGVTAAYEYLHCFTKHEPKDLSPIFRDHLEPAGFDLLMRMLRMNPRKRITVDEALRHEYFQNVYIPNQK